MAIHTINIGPWGLKAKVYVYLYGRKFFGPDASELLSNKNEKTKPKVFA